MKLGKTTYKLFLILLLVLNIGVNTSVNAQTLNDSLSKENKVAFKPDFKSQYKGRLFDYEEIKDYKPNFWTRFKLWLAQKLSDFFRSKSTDATLNVLEWIIIIGGILLIIFVIYKIIMAFINEEGNWFFGKKSDALDIATTDLEQNLLETDFDILIMEAVKQKEYRLAIRYYYLKTLKKLSEKQHIQWNYDKTNLQYYRELQNAELKSSFKHISYLYDYCWYGEFDLNEQEFLVGEKSFNNFIKQL